MPHNPKKPFKLARYKFGSLQVWLVPHGPWIWILVGDQHTEAILFTHSPKELEKVSGQSDDSFSCMTRTPETLFKARDPSYGLGGRFHGMIFRICRTSGGEQRDWLLTAC